MKHEVNGKRPKWITRALETRNFHASKLRDHPHWVLADTAKALCRSIGSISEDLLIASWLRTHETKLTKFKRAYEALEFIRECKKSVSSEHLDL